MKPPECKVCGRDRRDADGFKTVRFANYEPLPSGKVGHPKGLIWLCGEHLEAGSALSHLPWSEARERLTSDLGVTTRIVIIGNSGAGKSVLAGRLAQEHEATHLDLDTLVWEPEQIAVARDPEVAAADLRSFAASRSLWVAEGCYGDLALAVDDGSVELVWLDPGVEVCVRHCEARPWEPHKYASKQEQDARLPMLLDWVRDYETRDGPMSRAGHAATFEAWTGPKRHVFE